MKLALLFLSLGTYAGAGLAFLTQVLLARHLSLEDFGAFSTALAVVTLAASLAGLGISLFWLRAFGEEGKQGLRWIKPSVKLAILSITTILIMIYLWAFLAPHSDLTRDLLIILSLFILGQVAVELASAIYQLEERFINLAAWQFLPHAMRFVFLILVVWWGAAQQLSAITVAFIYLAVALTLFLIGAKLVSKAYRGTLSLVGHDLTEQKSEFNTQPRIINVLQQAWPFGLAGVFFLIYFQGSIVLVSYLLGNEAAAQYSVVVVIMTAIYLFPSLVYQKLLLPKIHRWASQDRKKLKQVYQKGNLLLLLLGAMTTVLVLVIAPHLIPIVFGNEYVSVMLILSILAFAIPIRFVATSVGSVLSTGPYMVKKVKYMGAVAAVNVLLTILFVEFIGLTGAAYAILVSDGLLLLLYYYAANKYVFKKAL